MADTFAGNVNAAAGEIPLTNGITPIPLPLTTLGASRLIVRAPSGEDMYIGPLGQVSHRIAANDKDWFTTRAQLFVSASPNTGVSTSSSSSSSSISPTNSCTYFYEYN
jgi:hypothetical protein